MLLSPIGSQEKPTQSPAEMLTSSKLHGLDVHQKECYHPGKMDQGMTTAQDLTFGELVRRHRRDRGLTQEALAEQATLSVRAISDLERGLKYRPRKVTVQLLARALGLSPEDGKAFERAARRGIDPGDSARHRDLPMGTYCGA